MFSPTVPAFQGTKGTVWLDIHETMLYNIGGFLSFSVMVLLLAKASFSQEGRFCCTIIVWNFPGHADRAMR